MKSLPHLIINFERNRFRPFNSINDFESQCSPSALELLKEIIAIIKDIEYHLEKREFAACLELIKKYDSQHLVICKKIRDLNKSFNFEIDHFLSEYHLVVFQYVQLCINQDELQETISLPTEEKEIPKYVTQAITEAYRLNCHYSQSNFEEKGEKVGYEIGTVEYKPVFKTKSLFSQLATQFEDCPLIVDLGCGENQVAENTDILQVVGITAENGAGRNSKKLIRGDIHNLLRLVNEHNLKPDVYISKFVFNFLCDPLHVLRDAYNSVSHYLFIDDIHIPGLSKKEVKNLFEYLRQQGYDIITGKSHRVEPDRFEWVGWIFMKKNHKKTLELPLKYAGVYQKFYNFQGTLYETPAVRYRPNSALTHFTPKMIQNEKQHAILRLKAWKLWSEKQYTCSGFFAFFSCISHSCVKSNKTSNNYVRPAEILRVGV